MPICPKCKSDYREEFEQCADCKVALVESLPDEGKVAGDVVNVYGTTNADEAAFLRSMLRDVGIESRLGNVGGGMMGSATPLKILVREDDGERAAKLIVEHYEKKKAQKDSDPEGASPE